MTIRTLAFGPGGPPRTSDLGLLVLRLGAGLPLALAHGLGKLPPSDGFIEGTAEMGFPVPVLFAWAAALAEFAGGLLVAAGLLTRPAAVVAAFTMAVAAFVRHGGDAFGDRELAIVYLVMLVAVALTGPGRFSLDALIGRTDPIRQKAT